MHLHVPNMNMALTRHKKKNNNNQAEKVFVTSVDTCHLALNPALFS